MTDLVKVAIIAALATVTSATIGAVAAILTKPRFIDRRLAHRPRTLGERRKDL